MAFSTRDLIPGDKLHDEGEVRLVQDDQASTAVEGDTSPIRASDIAWIFERALEARGCVNAVTAKAADELPALATVPRRQSPGVGRFEALGHQRSRGQRGWLGGRKPFSLNSALRDRALLDGQQRLPGLPVQDEKIAHLAGLGDGQYPLSLALNLDQRGGGRQVIVPEVMVHRLEGPDHLAGRGSQRYHRIGITVFTLSFAPKEVGAGAGGREKDKVARRIGRKGPPDVGAACPVSAILPGRPCGIG